MSNNLSKVLCFAVGAAIGSAVTWKVIKTRYEQIAQEEINSVKETFTRNFKHVEPIDSEADVFAEEEGEDEEEPDPGEELDDYEQLMIEEGYVEYEKKGGNETVKPPYVIHPTEFDEAGYETVTLMYYADKVLCDDYGNPIEDIEGMVGEDSLTHFGEFEDDSVFVRNERLLIDFEILLDEGLSTEVKRVNYDLVDEYDDEG